MLHGPSGDIIGSHYLLMERGQHIKTNKNTQKNKFVTDPMNYICKSQVDPGYQIQDSHFDESCILESFLKVILCFLYRSKSF